MMMNQMTMTNWMTHSKKGAAMAYEKEHPQGLADAMINMGMAFSDGVQLTEDTDEMLALVPAGLNSADEFKEDAASTFMYLGGRMLEKAADLRRAQKEAEPATAPEE
jgi:hypothetical protein